MTTEKITALLHGSRKIQVRVLQLCTCLSSLTSLSLSALMICAEQENFLVAINLCQRQTEEFYVQLFNRHSHRLVDCL